MTLRENDRPVGFKVTRAEEQVGVGVEIRIAAHSNRTFSDADCIEDPEVAHAAARIRAARECNTQGRRVHSGRNSLVEECLAQCGCWLRCLRFLEHIENIWHSYMLTVRTSARCHSEPVVGENGGPASGDSMLA